MEKRKYNYFLVLLKNLSFVVFLIPLLAFVFAFRSYSQVFLYSSYTGDEFIDNQWAIAKIDLNKAWKIVTGSSNVKVGIIDSGVDGIHEDLVDNINTSLSCAFNQFYTTGLEDLVNHGTNVAGIVGASGDNSIGISGVCWNVDLVSLRVANETNGDVDVDVVDDAITYANNNNIPIINMSFTDYNDHEDWETALQGYNGLVVCAAGNLGQNLDNNPLNLKAYPACYSGPRIISVGNSSSSDSIGASSNYGSVSVDLFAPGTAIYTTFPNDSYNGQSGTSMAAPMVTGVAALLLSIDPSLTALQLRNAILNGVDTCSSFNGYCSTGGRLNAYKAALNVIPIIPEQSTAVSYCSSSNFAKILRIECESSHYTLNFSGPSNYRVTLFKDARDTPIASVEYNDSSSHTLTFSSKLEQTVFVKVENLSGNDGYFDANVTAVSHDYTNSHILYDDYYHRSFCLCGASILKPHIFNFLNICVVCDPHAGPFFMNEDDVIFLEGGLI